MMLLLKMKLLGQVNIGHELAVGSTDLNQGPRSVQSQSFLPCLLLIVCASLRSN